VGDLHGRVKWFLARTRCDAVRRSRNMKVAVPIVVFLVSSQHSHCSLLTNFVYFVLESGDWSYVLTICRSFMKSA
jgi:hypothetical protein